jgi:hypothetical protein
MIEENPTNGISLHKNERGGNKVISQKLSFQKYVKMCYQTHPEVPGAWTHSINHPV